MADGDGVPEPSTSPAAPEGLGGGDAGDEALLPIAELTGGARRRGRIPVIRQMSEAECGAACLAMVLAYHGRMSRLEEVREVVGVDRDGCTLLDILDGGDYYGLRGRGVRIDVEDFEWLPPGAILHWDFNHFVVFERLVEGDDDDAIAIVDPALGRRRVAMGQVRKSFTGAALVLEPGEKFEKAERTDRPLRRYLGRVLGERAMWTRILVMSVLLQLLALALPVLTGALVDRVVPRGDYHLLMVLCGGLGAMVAFDFLASMVRAHLLLHMRTHLDKSMTLDFLEHLVALPYAFFQKRSTGDLMMRLNSNATIREILTASALSGLLDGTLVGLYLVILLLLSPLMGLLVLGLGAAYLATFLLTRRRQQELMAQSLAVQSKSESYQVEMLAGIESLKAMGSEQRAVEHWSNLFVDTLNVAYQRGRLSALVESLTATLRLGGPLAVLVTGTLLVLRGDLSLGTMLALNALAGGFLTPLANLTTTASQFQLLGSYIERLDDVLSAAPEQDRQRVRKAPDLSGRIDVDGVSFRYGPTAPLVVREVSVAIAPGQFVALVGRSGSGKSTLASLLVGLYRPTAGNIRFDGVDLAEIEVRSLRRQLGIVTQRPYLFGSSLRANIAIADPALPMERVVEAARLAQIEDDIAAMPMGYETLLTDGGASLSGGQRQRVALARALVRRPAVLLLDEATSALDTVTEARVHAALAGLRCTRIVIAHRLSTIVNADVILVLDNGSVVERGTHEELVSLGGVYAELVRGQVG